MVYMRRIRFCAGCVIIPLPSLCFFTPPVHLQDGQEEDLDDCGGHAHTGMPYHYHPSVQQDMTSVEPGTTNGNNFTSYWMAPKYCFKGNVTAQPNFWTSDGGQVSARLLIHYCWC